MEMLEGSYIVCLKNKNFNVCKESTETKWNFQHGGLNKTKKKTIQRGVNIFRNKTFTLYVKIGHLSHMGIKEIINALVTLLLNLGYFSLQTF